MHNKVAGKETARGTQGFILRVFVTPLASPSTSLGRNLVLTVWDHRFVNCILFPLAQGHHHYGVLTLDWNTKIFLSRLNGIVLLGSSCR